MTEPAPVLVWLRRDLRLRDNPAIFAAAGRPAIPVFIREDDRKWAPGGAARWWRGASLGAFQRALHGIGSDLVLRSGYPAVILPALAAETGARDLVFNRSYEPADMLQEADVAAAMRGGGVGVRDLPGNRLHEPWTLKIGAGSPYRVFTPFWRKLLETYRPPRALPAPTRLVPPDRWPGSEPVASLAVPDAWADGMAATWTPGESGANVALARFIDGCAAYADMRDRPDVEGTSRLSPHLAWGEISVHEIWRQVVEHIGDPGMGFLREIGWRDFNTHLLYHFRDLPTQPWNASFKRFPFVKSPSALKAWQRGRTGFPLVDAGMRQLWRTGWMHNRVRMIVGSFLVKDLLTDWREGEAWFWDTLVDADLAQNAGNWQWVAGCGADAAPFFRIFNPTSQSEKFDPDGDYIRRWVPELAALTAEFIHQPWTARPLELADAGVALGKTYPFPMIDHAKARSEALAIYQRISGRTSRK